MTNKRITNRWKLSEFSLLILISLAMIFISVKSFSSKEEYVSGLLVEYKCELWKESSLIYSHTVEIAGGLKFSIRTKDIMCSQKINPKSEYSVTLIVKGKKLLGLSQQGVELLSYDILVKDSRDSSNIVFFFTVIFVLATFWSFFRLKS